MICKANIPNIQREDANKQNSTFLLNLYIFLPDELNRKLTKDGVHDSNMHLILRVYKRGISFLIKGNTNTLIYLFCYPFYNVIMIKTFVLEMNLETESTEKSGLWSSDNLSYVTWGVYFKRCFCNICYPFMTVNFIWQVIFILFFLGKDYVFSLFCRSMGLQWICWSYWQGNAFKALKFVKFLRKSCLTLTNEEHYSHSFLFSRKLSEFLSSVSALLH